MVFRQNKGNSGRRNEAYRKALHKNTELNLLQYKIERNAIKLIRLKKKKYL